MTFQVKFKFYFVLFLKKYYNMVSRFFIKSQTWKYTITNDCFDSWIYKYFVSVYMS